MSGRTKWSALRDPVMADPERRARIEARERAMTHLIVAIDEHEAKDVSDSKTEERPQPHRNSYHRARR